MNFTCPLSPLAPIHPLPLTRQAKAACRVPHSSRPMRSVGYRTKAPPPPPKLHLHRRASARSRITRSALPQTSRISTPVLDLHRPHRLPRLASKPTSNRPTLPPVNHPESSSRQQISTAKRPQTARSSSKHRINASILDVNTTSCALYLTHPTGGGTFTTAIAITSRSPGAIHITLTS